MSLWGSWKIDLRDTACYSSSATWAVGPSHPGLSGVVSIANSLGLPSPITNAHGFTWVSQLGNSKHLVLLNECLRSLDLKLSNVKRWGTWCVTRTHMVGYRMDDPWVLRVSSGSRPKPRDLERRQWTCLSPNSTATLPFCCLQFKGSHWVLSGEIRNTLGSRMSQHRECKKFIIYKWTSRIYWMNNEKIHVCPITDVEIQDNWCLYIFSASIVPSLCCPFR